jgi:hypothetical protein
MQLCAFFFVLFSRDLSKETSHFNNFVTRAHTVPQKGTSFSDMKVRVRLCG